MSEGKKIKDQEETDSGSGYLESKGFGGGCDGKRAKNFAGIWKKLLLYVKEDWPMMIVALLCAVGSTVLALLGPKQLSGMADTVLAGIVTGIDMNLIERIGVTLAAFYGCSFLLSMAHRQILATVEMRVAKKMRSDISEKSSRLPAWDYDRMTDDVDTISQSLNQGIGTMTTAIITLAGSFLLMVTTNRIMATISVLFPLIGCFLTLLIRESSGKVFLKQQKCREEISTHLGETYAGHTVIKAYNGEENARKTFTQRNENLRESTFQAQCLSGLMRSLMIFTGNFGYMAVCVVGAVLTMNGRISFGVILAFLMYVWYFTQSLSRLIMAIQALQAAAAAGVRVSKCININQDKNRAA